MRYFTNIIRTQIANDAKQNKPLIQHPITRSLCLFLMIFVISTSTSFGQYSVPTPLKKSPVRNKLSKITILKKNLHEIVSDSLYTHLTKLDLNTLRTSENSLIESEKSIIIDFYQLDEEELDDLNELFASTLTTKIDPSVAFDIAEMLNTEYKAVLDSIKHYEKSVKTNVPDINIKNKNIFELKYQRKKLKEYRNLFYSINALIGKPNLKRSFIPLRNTSNADFYYEHVNDSDVELLNSTVIQGASDKSVVVSELVTGYISIFRLKLNTVIYNNNEADSAATIVDKINNGGGLLTANLDYPVFFRRWNQVAFEVISNFKWSSDIESFGNELPKDEYIGYFEPSLNAYLEMKIRQTNASLFFNYKYGRVYASKALDDTIGNESRNSFNVSTLYAGINFSNKIRLSANIPLKSIEGIGGTDNFTVGIQYTPQNKEQK